LADGDGGVATIDVSVIELANMKSAPNFFGMSFLRTALTEFYRIIQGKSGSEKNFNPINPVNPV